MCCGWCGCGRFHTGYCENLSGSSSEILQDNRLKIITVKNSFFSILFCFIIEKDQQS